MNIINPYRFGGDTLANGLIGYYPFNGNANDESVNSNNGTVTGAVLTTDKNGVPDSAYDFDGVNDSIVLDSSAFYNEDENGLLDLSLSCWIYVDVADIDNNFMTAVDSSGGSPQGASGYFILVDDRSANGFDHSIRISYKIVGGSTAATMDCDNCVTTTGWYHIVWTYKQGATLVESKLYLNNSEIASITHPLGTRFESRDIGTSFGLLATKTTGDFNGKIDQARFYNRALDTTEISDLYNGYL